MADVAFTDPLSCRLPKGGKAEHQFGYNQNSDDATAVEPASDNSKGARLIAAVRVCSRTCGGHADSEIGLPHVVLQAAAQSEVLQEAHPQFSHPYRNPQCGWLPGILRDCSSHAGFAC